MQPMTPSSILALVLILTSAGQIHARNEKVPERIIVVSIPDRKLALLENGEVVKIYEVAVGAPSTPSPAGEFKIIHLILKPTYYAPGKVIPPGKSNPVGTRWIGLSLKSFGIHGTNAPRSIGKNESHGCIRLRNRDVEELFQRVEIGDAVEIHGEIGERVAQVFNHPPFMPAEKQPVQPPLEVAIALGAAAE
jgi:lipoprotein-anchoring transpeptidase ErfK/SrfK